MCGTCAFTVSHTHEHLQYCIHEPGRYAYPSTNTALVTDTAHGQALRYGPNPALHCHSVTYVVKSECNLRRRPLDRPPVPVTALHLFIATCECELNGLQAATAAWLFDMAAVADVLHSGDQIPVGCLTYHSCEHAGRICKQCVLCPVSLLVGQYAALLRRAGRAIYRRILEIDRTPTRVFLLLLTMGGWRRAAPGAAKEVVRRKRHARSEGGRQAASHRGRHDMY